jgi:hypothetical protein
VVLVEPPKPDWLIKKEESDKAEGKGEAPKALNRGEQKLLVDMLSDDYMAITNAMSDEEKKAYRKMSTPDKGRFMKRRLGARLLEGSKGKPKTGSLVNSEEN